MGLEGLPESWVVWNEAEGGRVVVVYRPDVFDTEAFPAECLPTLYVTRGAGRGRRPPGETATTGTGGWAVTLYLEPDVNLPERSYGSREAALAGAVDLARAFDRGELDYRGAYQVPREEYLAKLDALTGDENHGEGCDH